MMTGAIDRNDVIYFVRMELPDSGLWSIIKAETNLSGETWDHWIMFLGEGTQIPSQEKDRLLYSRNFASGKYFAKHNAIVFSGGEVRNGEPVLKAYNIELVAGNNIYLLAHSSRISAEEKTSDPMKLLKYALEQDKPSETIDIPVETSDSLFPGPHFLDC